MNGLGNADSHIDGFAVPQEASSLLITSVPRMMLRWDDGSVICALGCS
jgi:hypothetical protein